MLGVQNHPGMPDILRINLVHGLTAMPTRWDDVHVARIVAPHRHNQLYPVLIAVTDHFGDGRTLCTNRVAVVQYTARRIHSPRIGQQGTSDITDDAAFEVLWAHLSCRSRNEFGK